MKAVNLPGSLYFSAASTVSFHAEAYALRAGKVHQRFGESAAREHVDDFQRCRIALAGLDHVGPLLAGGIGQQFRFLGEQVGEKTHVVRVVGDHQEVERPRQLRLLPAGSRQLLAAREAIGVLDAEAVAECAGVHRHGRVQVRVAEVHLRRVAGGGRRLGRGGGHRFTGLRGNGRRGLFALVARATCSEQCQGQSENFRGGKRGVVHDHHISCICY